MKNFRLLIFIFSSLLLLQGCGIFGSNDDNSSNFPETVEEIEKSVENTSQIANSGWYEIEDEIENINSSNENIDPEEIAEKLEDIEGVRSASKTTSGTGITIEQEDGTYSNILIVRKNDERLFERTTNKSKIIKDLHQTNSLNKSYSNFRIKEFPNGEGKALILAPFQSDFDKDLNQIENSFEVAGFEVDTYINSNADLDRFNGEFLTNYDAIFIDTHGAASFKTRDGRLSTVLLTGEKQSSDREKSLSSEERRALAIGIDNGTPYYAITVQWLNETVSDEFPRSWIFASACESSMIDNGEQSLSESLFQLGAGGYSGYDETIVVPVAESAGEKLTALLTSGQALSDASDNTRNDIILRAEAWILRVVGGNDAARVELLDDRQRISEPFHLFDPDEIVGIAEIIPSFGPPGTDVVYEVEINERFSNEVTDVEFDIDNTGENITMDQVNSTLWRTEGLTAPTAENYPRVDTFTFTASNSNNEVVGKGSATFTIQEPSSNKTLNSMKNKYVSQ